MALHDFEAHDTGMEELFDLVRKIPRGRCASYGRLGSVLSRPVSGFIVGRWMARAYEGVPWWRVTAKDGRLPIWKSSPEYAREQRRLLEQEGVRFVDEAVAPEHRMTADEVDAIGAS